MKDYYDILHVSKNDSIKTIKQNFKKLSLKYHPDKNKDSISQIKFKLLNEAYEVLKDPYMRGRYDVEYEKHFRFKNHLFNSILDINILPKKSNQKSIIKSKSIIKNINGETFVKEKLIQNNNGKINEKKNIYKIDKNGNKILSLE